MYRYPFNILTFFRLRTPTPEPKFSSEDDEDKVGENGEGEKPQENGALAEDVTPKSKQGIE